MDDAETDEEEEEEEEEEYRGVVPSTKEGCRTTLQLNRKNFVDRIRLEEKLSKKGPRLLHYICVIVLYVTCLGTYDPILAIAEVHRALGQRYETKMLKDVKDIDDVMAYLDLFIKKTYTMASALIDANTMDSIDLVRCFDPDVTDICQLKFWTFPDYNRSAPNYVNISDVENPDSRIGINPARPVILDSRMDYPHVGVVSLAPVVWQTRAARVPCEGFGNFYNDQVLGAGMCLPGQDCNLGDGRKVTSFQAPYPNPTGKTLKFYITYEEPAFRCVDRAKPAESFWDKSWFPSVSWDQLKNGVQLQSKQMDGQEVFFKFVSDVAYLQAPIQPKANGKLIPWDHEMWQRQVVHNNTDRKAFNKEYLDSTYQNRRNTFVTFETTSLSIAALIISPQAENYADITTLAQVTFTFSQYGLVETTTSFESTSQTFAPWYILVCFFLLNSLSFIISACRKMRHPSGRHLDNFMDLMIPMAANAHLAWQVAVDLSPPHVVETLQDAFTTNSEDVYFDAFKVVSDYSYTLREVRFVGFLVCLAFVMRAITLYAIHPRLEMLFAAFFIGLSDISHIATALLPLVLLLAFLGFWMFGTTSGSAGFETFGNALRNTVPYVVPAMPGGWTSHKGDLLFILWAITCIFVMRFFYLMIIASVIKGFNSAKEQVSRFEAENSLLKDTAQVLKMRFEGRRNGWPQPEQICIPFEKDLNLKLSDQGPNAVTAEELLQVLGSAIKPEAAASLLQRYANIVEDNGTYPLVEKDSKRLWPDAIQDVAENKGAANEGQPQNDANYDNLRRMLEQIVKNQHDLSFCVMNNLSERVTQIQEDQDRQEQTQL